MVRDSGQRPRGTAGDETMARALKRASSGRGRWARAGAMASAAAVVVAGGCRSERADVRGATRRGPLEVHTTERGVVRSFVYDTLSPSALIVTIVPERGDGARAVVFTFADTMRRVTSGLGIVQRDDTTREARLVWPDSVMGAWWSGPAALAFMTRTGRGVYAVGDVRADTLAVVSDTGASPPPPKPAPVPPGARERATAYVDSAYLQPPGRAAERSALRYVVRSIVAAPGGELAAFYVVATDSTGRRVNPSWHVMELPSGAVAPLDSIIGPADELQESAAAWGGEDGRRFFWARRTALQEASIASAGR